MMYWAIHFMEKGIPFLMKDYLNDEFTVYAGLYGVPSYVVWYMAPDKTKEIYVGLHFRLMLFKYEQIIFYDEFIIRDARYDVTQQMFKIYAEGAAFGLLSKAAKIPSNIWVSNKSQPISGKRVLENVIKDISKGNITVEPQEPLKDLTQYVSMSFDNEFSVLDLISKICRENRWEWYLRSDKLFLSNSLVQQQLYVGITEEDWESKKFINYVSFTNVTLPSNTCEPGASYADEGRVIWVKFHIGGDIGDQMNFMVYNFKFDFLREDTFISTLNGIARDLGNVKLLNDYKQFPVILGKIFNTPTSDNINKYEANTFGGDVRNATKDLNTHEFKAKYVGTEKKIIGADNVKISTPYAGDGVGVLYPQQDGHAVLFSPNGERELPIVGPRYFGFDEQVPARNSELDYRLQLPDGTTIFNKDDNTLFIVANKKIEIASGGMFASSLARTAASPSVIIDHDKGEITIKDQLGINIVTVKGSEVSIQGASIKIDGGIVEINGVKIIKGGIVDCTLLKTSGGVVPPNIL